MTKRDHNQLCEYCHGHGGVEVSRADIQPDTPRDVVKAVADAPEGTAFITCGACYGTGLFNRLND